MPRNRGNVYYKPTRVVIQSGVTYVTRPSGVTIQKDSVGTTGITISGANISSTYGYPLHVTTKGQMVVSGVTLVKSSGKNWLAASFGLSTLTNLVVSPGDGVTTPIVASLVKIDNTEATCYLYTAGVTVASAVTVNYIAVGT